MAAPEERLLEVRIELERLVNEREMMVVGNIKTPNKYGELSFETLNKRFTNLQERLISLIQLGK